MGGVEGGYYAFLMPIFMLQVMLIFYKQHLIFIIILYLLTKC